LSILARNAYTAPTRRLDFDPRYGDGGDHFDVNDTSAKRFRLPCISMVVEPKLPTMQYPPNRSIS